MAQVERDPQPRRRCGNSNQQGQDEQERRVLDAWLHAHGRHAGVMHGADTQAQQYRAQHQLHCRKLRLRNQPQGKSRRYNG